MTTPIADPRTIVVQLEASRREKGAYLFHSEVAPLLQVRGWEIVKHAAGFAHCRPPAGGKPPFTFDVTVPSREQIKSLASELHAVNKPWTGQIGEWPARYFKHLQFSYTQVDVFSDEETPSGASPERWELLVGFHSIWSAAVVFADGVTAYRETLAESGTSTGTAHTKAARNPPWQRDELILALAVYLTTDGGSGPKSGPAISELSEVLNALPIHPQRGGEDFRNPNSVYMKLQNFRRFDPKYGGGGLPRGNKLEKGIWEEFSGDPTSLQQLAEQIKTGYKLAEADGIADSEEEIFPEGRILYRLHRLHERDPRVIEKAKEAAKKKNNGKLLCCVCSFDFVAKYGEIGEDYIEGHHIKPLSEMTQEVKSKASDIALVCANCHRMLHRRRPWLGLDQLKTLLKS